MKLKEEDKEYSAYYKKKQAAFYNQDLETKDVINAYFETIKGVPLLTPEDDIELSKRIKEGDEEARNILIKANLRYVVMVAKNYVGQGLSFADLIQEGNIGLIKATSKYDPSHGTRFLSYAGWWIKQSIIRAIADKSRMIRIPVHLGDEMRKIIVTSKDLAHRLGREPEDFEIAEETGISIEKISFLKKINEKPTSLNVNIFNEDEDTVIEDFQVDINPLPEDILIEKDKRPAIEKALSTLSKRQEEAVRIKFGLDDGIEKTLEETGKIMGITREGVRQLVAKSLVRLKSKTEIRMIEYDIEPKVKRGKI